jgi:SAM-dependent methyltransferase
MQIQKDHLGGYEQGGDPATYYPDLWDWAVRTWTVSTVLDVGCGEGHSLKYFRDRLGCLVTGVEGLPQEDKDIVQWDFTKGPWLPVANNGVPINKSDMIWCCEFLEHVEEKYLWCLTPAFTSTRLILMTHATPGQGGYHHVNCRDAEYWRGFFAALGFQYDPGATIDARIEAAKNDNPYNHFKRAGMVFRKV